MQPCLALAHFSTRLTPCPWLPSRRTRHATPNPNPKALTPATRCPLSKCTAACWPAPLAGSSSASHCPASVRLGAACGSSGAHWPVCRAVGTIANSQLTNYSGAR